MRISSLPTRAAALIIGLLAAGCSGSTASVVESSNDDGSAIATSTTVVPSTTVAAAPSPTTTLEAPAVDVGDSWFLPELAEVDCQNEAVRSSCYEFTVAADRMDPDGGVVVLPVFVAHATGDAPLPDPIIIPAGGPGFPGTTGFAFADQNPFINERDVIFYDQRGIGLARPSLNCPESEAVFIENLTAANDPEVESAAATASINACLDRLEGEGVDLTDYTTEASARDLDDIRQALGYEQWNLVGISYGGRLSLTSMRRFPDGIRSVILDSPVSPDWGGAAWTRASGERSFMQLAEDCAASPACDVGGDLLEMIDRVVERYNADPVEVDVPVDGGTETMIITGDDMIGGLFDAMYVTTLLPALPGVISQLDQGETAIVAQLAANAIPRGTAASEAMTIAMNCADTKNLDIGAAEAEAIENPGRWSTVMTTQYLCPPDWPSSAVDFNEPVQSELPVLLLAGRYDPITPPGPTETIGATLVNSTFLYIGNGGHGLVDSSPCVAGIAAAFLADPDVDLDVGCVSGLASTAFG